MNKLSLTKRLSVVLTSATVFVFVVFFAATWWAENRSLESMLQQNGRSLSIGLEQSIGLGLELDETEFVRDAASSVANMPNVLSVDVYNKYAERLVVLGHTYDTLSLQQLSRAKQGALFYETRDSGRVERVISLVRGNHGTVIGYAVLDLSRATVNASIESTLMISGMLSVLLLLLFWRVIWLAVREIKQPLEELDHAVKSVTKGKLDVVVNTTIPDPLASIATGFNRMTQTLANERQSLRLQSEALEVSERRFRELFTHMPVPMYMADMNGRLRQCNPAMALLFGYASDVALLDDVTYMSELYARPEERDVVIAELLRAQSIVRREVELLSPSGKTLQCILNAHLVVDEENRPKGVEGMIQDLTEYRLLESNLQQAQKMEVVGQLAGGVAHDFNNLLSVIIGNAELLDLHAVDETSLTYVKRIEKAALRASELTKNLLGFARKGAMRHESISVAALLREVGAMIESTCDRRVNISLQIDRDDVQVMGDPGQLHQLLMNLLMNALHAMPNGGDLLIKMTSKHDTLAIQVKDSGVGMNKETIEHIFEPFFTTRKLGEGTGLGLSMVYGIVEKMDGSITVDSQLGEGATFELELPVVQGKIRVVESAIERSALKIDGRVLFVDDEEELRTIADKALSLAGLDVICTESGEQALSILEDNPDLIDIVLLDLNMPGLGGVETLRVIRRTYTSMKVIVLSGYSEETLDVANDELYYDGFMMKPYELSMLYDEISRVLKK